MKNKNLLIVMSAALFLCGCGNNPSPTSQTTTGVTSSPTSAPTSQPTTTTGKSTSTGPSKVTVPAHTIKDSNPPVDSDAIGDVVTEATWDSFKNASSSKFNNHYNYTYNAYSGGSQTIEAFTKNGYYAQSVGGKIYYERKSGSTFYTYISTNEGYLRQETTFDIQSRYTSRLQNEIYTHMFDYSNYEYDSFDGCYRYYATGFTAAAKFKGGYLTYLYYIVGYNFFEIKLAFKTSIDIPQSYYYQ